MSAKVRLTLEGEKVSRVFNLVEIALAMGTSIQQQVGSAASKRSFSIHRTQPDPVVVIRDHWRSKGRVESTARPTNTHERLFIPANNVERKKEDGCMNKLKIERSLKLRQEETKGRDFNILSGTRQEDKVWIQAFGD